MNKKRIILLVCLGILSVMLLTSIGSAAPAQESAYVHVVHNYSGTLVGMTNDVECSQNDIVYWEQTEMVSFSNMIKTTYNGRSYVVDRIELHDELANIEIRLLKSGDYQGLTENTYDLDKEKSRGTETFVINTLPEMENIIDIFQAAPQCGTEHVTTWPTPTNIRKITDVWKTDTSMVSQGNNNGQTGLYPLTGEITSFLYGYQDSLKVHTGANGGLDRTNPETELADGGHYVLKIFYKPIIVVYEMDGDVYYRVTFYPEDGVSEPIVKIVRKGSYVAEPTLEETRQNWINYGWYTDNVSYTTRWIFETDKVTQDMNLYANWGYLNTTIINIVPGNETEEIEVNKTQRPPEPEPEPFSIPWGWDTAGTAGIFVILAALIAGRERIKKE